MMVTIDDDTETPEEIAAIAADLTRRHGASALGHCRMQLYAAVNQRNTRQIRLMTNVCLVLMRDAREQQARSA